MLGYRIAIGFLLFVISSVILWNLIGDEQMDEYLRVGLAGFASLGIAFVIVLLFHLIKPPAPKRGDANFIINYEYPQIVSVQGFPVKDKMHWVQVHTSFRISHPIEIQTLALLFKGKPWIAHEWKPIMSNRMLTHSYHFFQIPTGVDLTKHKAELVASTNDEDYGSGKFYIKQRHKRIV